ncbi:MAG TPA: hypothetical protein VKH41_04690 [Myxococcota bacterium]|nr:hypothetical protein [Myxococcota bacterium]
MSDPSLDSAALWHDFARRVEGPLAVCFRFADTAPKTQRRVVPFDRVRRELPPETPATTPSERSAMLARRTKAPRRRYAY